MVKHLVLLDQLEEKLLQGEKPLQLSANLTITQGKTLSKNKLEQQLIDAGSLFFWRF